MRHHTANNFGSNQPAGEYGPETMMHSIEMIEAELVMARSGMDQSFTEERIDRLEMAVEILIGFLKFQILK